MGPICPSVCSGEVRIAAPDLDDEETEPTPGWLTLHCLAWDLFDPFPLWRMFTDNERGENLVMPHARGRRAEPKRPDEMVEHLLFGITGYCDRFGVMYGDGSLGAQMVGLETNLAFLEAHIGPPALPAKTRAAKLIMPSADERDAEVQMSLTQGFHLQDYARFTLNLTVPTGSFV